MEKEGLPRYSPVDEHAVHRGRRHHRHRGVKLFVIACLVYLVYGHWQSSVATTPQTTRLLSAERLHDEYAICSKLRSNPKDPSGPRDRNARYIDGHNAILIRNATVWTGEPAAGTTPEEAHAGMGYAWVSSDVLMEHGLIKRVESKIRDSELPRACEVYDAHGRQLTAGIVDMHSHAGPDPLPSLPGGEDENELSSDITPYVRSIDGLNPLDPQLQVIKSGGVTTSLVLPGSGNNMGGEAYVIKHAVGKKDGRAEIAQEDMLADPDRNWRYMKMACGENAKRVYGRVGRDFGPFSRMGEAWEFRHAFEQATALMKSQDDWCVAADQLGAENMKDYLPLDLKWESLGAVLRGQVHVNTHCYTIADLEAFVRHTNEWKFPIRAFHHAHQTYLVPEILKRAYGEKPPAAALFADNMYYKVEAYIASEQAGKILYDNGITPVYVSDNPVLNAQHLVFEAAKAYKNGLMYHAALAGVTSASAELLGLGERIGKVKAGFDADVVVWDSDPLSVGATPVQVWIDGTPQFENPMELKKPVSAPIEPDESLQAIKTDKADHSHVIFTGVSKVLLPGQEQTNAPGSGNVVIANGTILCMGQCETELQVALSSGIEIIPLRNGYISPPLTAFGTHLGLEEIQGEPDTQDGSNGDETFSSAVNGLSLDTKTLKASYSHGVTRAITAPKFKNGGHRGTSVGFRTGALHAFEKDAVWQDAVALHYTLTLAAKQGKTPTLSGAVDRVMESLLKAIEANETIPNSGKFGEEAHLMEVVSGNLPLALTIHSADMIASALWMKVEVDKAIKAKAGVSEKGEVDGIRMVIIGGAESHLLAEELADANVGVVLAPMLAYAKSWDQRRSLTGAPLTNGTALDVLLDAGVLVAIANPEDWEVRDLHLLAGIAYSNGGGRLSESQALALAGANIYKILGVQEEVQDEFVVFEGNPLEIGSRVRGVSDGRGKVSVWT